MENEGMKTLKGLLFGILLYTIPFILIGIIVVNNKIPYFLGLFLGMILAMGIAVNMYRCLDFCLELDPESAEKTMRKKAILRFLVMAVVVGLAFCFPNVLHPLGIFFGLMGLKVSAYVQPFIHR